MSPSRREFVYTLGSASAALALYRAQAVVWTDEGVAEAQWRPGVEDRSTSTCLICPARCGIRGRMVDGQLVEITGNPLHPMSRGGVCPRGLAGMQMLYHPQRLGSPLERIGPRGSGEWREITRDEAIGRIADRLRGLRSAGRPEALALLTGYCAGTMSDLWDRFLRAFGSPNRVRDAYDDATETAMSLVHGIRRPPGYDLDHARLALSFGAPLLEAWWSPLQAMVAFSGRGAEEGMRTRIIQIDTRFSRTAAGVDDWVGIRPGTYATLALGIAYVIMRDELVDSAFLARHVAGFEDFTDDGGRRRDGYRSQVMRNYRPEEVSAETGVPVTRITELAREFARGSPSVAVCGSDVTRSPDGLLAALAVHSLNILVGSISRQGGVLFGDEPRLDPLAPEVLDGTALAGLEREPITGWDPTLGGGERALRFAENAVLAPEATVDALLLYYANPLASSPRPSAWREALAKIPFVVSFSPFLDETSRGADLILPDLLPYERWQDAPTPPSYPYPVWGLTQPWVDPHPGASHTGDVVLALARDLGGSVADSVPYESFESLLKARARGLFATRHGMVMGEEFERRDQRQMEQLGWWLPEYLDYDAFWQALVERGGWMDLFVDETDPARISRRPSGRIDLMPAELIAALEQRGQAPTPYVSSSLGIFPSSDEYPLRLLPYRLSTLASGTLGLQRWLAEQPTVIPDIHWTPWVEVNRETAREAGIADGEEVWLASSTGRYRARVQVLPGIAPGTAAAPYGLRHPDGELANPLQLLNETVDPLTGLLSWSSTPVRLERG